MQGAHPLNFVRALSFPHLQYESLIEGINHTVDIYVDLLLELIKVRSRCLD